MSSNFGWKNPSQSGIQASSASTPAGFQTQSAYDQLNLKVGVLEDEIRELVRKDHAKNSTIFSLQRQLDDAESAKTQLNGQLIESYEVSKILKEGKEELFLAVVNLNERLEAQNRMTAEAQTVFLKLPAAIRALKRLDDETVKLRKDKSDTAIEMENLHRMMASMQETNDKQLEEVTDLRAELESQLASFRDVKLILEKANATTAAAAASLAGKLEESQARERASSQSNRELAGKLDEAEAREKASLQSKEEASERLRSQQETMSLMLTLHAPKDSKVVDKIGGMGGNETYLWSLVDDLKYKLFKSEMKCKQQHNTLQELRGNIRVFVRCRPYINYDGDDALALEGAGETNDSTLCGGVRFYKDNSSVALAGSVNIRDKPKVFSFDQVFKAESTQEDVYKQVTDLVQSALDGYKVCIFSYGQTGSGKTHTMTGEKDGSLRGIIPRSVEQIIEQVINMRGNGWDVVVTTSMVEIYNEELRDLLDNEPLSNSEKNKLKISNLQGFVTIAGVTSVELITTDMKAGRTQLEGLLDRAAKTRMTACTAMNERSSRSHALFMLDITARHKDGITVMKGGLRLVDLAGSERLDRTGNLSDPARFKETVNINKSLSCLADVFMSLGNKSSHIPYRNSKLTMVLQDCLSGDGKALMFVNISPTHASCSETLCSLRFANQVSQVELGKASKNVSQLAAPSPPSPVPVPIAEKDLKSPFHNRERAALANVVSSLTARKLSRGVSKKAPRSTPSRGIRPTKSQSELMAQHTMLASNPLSSDVSETSSESSASFSRAYNSPVTQAWF